MMSDPSLSNQSKTPDQSVVSSQQSQPLTPQNSQGSAMLDAQAETGGMQPDGEPVSASIATNFSSATAAGDPKTAGASGEMGTFVTQDPSPEKGAVNLHNNPDVPSSRSSSPQGKLPDTGAIQLPMNDDTNLPD
jgi:hypothetical protein